MENQKTEPNHGDISNRIKRLVDVFADGNNSKFASMINSSEANVRKYIAGSQPGFKAIASIAKNIEVNYEWLLTGKGEMLRAVEKEDKNSFYTSQVSESLPVYTQYQKVPISNSKRIGLFVEKKNISVRVLEKVIGASNGAIGRAINNGTDIHSIWISRIIESYPDLNPEWLLTGRGPMLRPVEAMEEAPQTLEEPRSGYGKAREVNPTICSTCEERERIIASKDKEISSLERQIEGLKAGFENQIEDLKNNLGMVIASKDAMLAMKEKEISMVEEAVRMKEKALENKDEIIGIQSKRISELESHRETEDLKKILGTSERIGQENISLTDIHELC